MILIKKGAEAEIYLTEFLGRKAILKRRISKKYRIEELDRKIRSERTKGEARIIRRARLAGIRTPIIYDINIKNMEITMEYLDYPRIKDIINEVERPKKERIAEHIGKTVALLHSTGIIHGDLTTSNMLLMDPGIALIDFGLAEISMERERMASDLRVLKEGWKSAHYEYEDLLSSIMDTYKASWPGGVEVMKILEKAESRRRYVKKS